MIGILEKQVEMLKFASAKRPSQWSYLETAELSGAQGFGM